MQDALYGDEPTKLSVMVAEEGENWAMADAAANSLEESKKTVLARITLEYLERGIPSSRPGEAPKAMPQSQADIRGLADPRYAAHLEQMVAARREAHLARVRYDMGKMFIELHRSKLATKRQEMAMNGERGMNRG